MREMNLCILLMSQFLHAASVPFTASPNADNFVWCKIINLPLVRLIILQPED